MSSTGRPGSASQHHERRRRAPLPRHHGRIGGDLDAFARPRQRAHPLRRAGRADRAPAAAAQPRVLCERPDVGRQRGRARGRPRGAQLGHARSRAQRLAGGRIVLRSRAEHRGHADPARRPSSAAGGVRRDVARRLPVARVPRAPPGASRGADPRRHRPGLPQRGAAPRVERLRGAHGDCART